MVKCMLPGDALVVLSILRNHFISSDSISVLTICEQQPSPNMETHKIVNNKYNQPKR